MKRRVLVLLLTVMTVFALTACTQSDTKDGAGQAASGAPGTQNSGQGSVSGDASGEGNASGESAPASVSGGSASDGSAVEAGQSGEAAAAADDGYEENISYEDAEDETSVSEEEENYSDDELDGLSEEGSVSSGIDWSGSYTSDEGETLTLTAIDAASISFAFANSGISGTAELDGSQAVYHGDDHHVVVFEYVEGAINVSVLSEEDYDTSESPLNGLYVSQ